MMAYDSADGYVVMYGGVYFTISNETWSYSGFVWTLEHPAANPGAVCFGAMAYDGVDGVVVLQGGITLGPNNLNPASGSAWLY